MILLSLFMMFSPKAVAWEQHQTIQAQLLETRAAKRRIYPYREITTPCPADEKKEIAVIAKDLQIDGSKVPIFTAGLCKPGEKTSKILLTDLFTSSMIDEPDMGMDQNLPPSADPQNFRRWMGGETGPTSQGFRHMYFPGFELLSPLKTFQVPTGRVGDALERIKKIRAESDAYFAKDDKFWGTRLLLWELHYVQDLHQPFHVIQIPTFHFLQPKKILTGIVKAATHAIANYHYAYEGIALEFIKSAPTTDFKNCFETIANDTPDPSFTEAFELVTYPHSVGNELGLNVYHLLGDALKSEEVDLPNGIGPIDYFALTKISEPSVVTDDEMSQLTSEEIDNYHRSHERWKALQEVKRITCDLVKAMSEATWNELDRAFIKTVQPRNSISAKTAK